MQGVVFNKINDNELDKYSLIISASNNSDISKSKLITIEKEKINEIFHALTGNIILSDKDMIKAPVSTLCSNILNSISKKYEEQNLPFIRKWFWPNFKKVCYLITHDIDEIDNYPKTKNKSELLKYALSRLILKNYNDNIEKILSLEDEKKITSTFFFLSKYNRKFQKYMELRKNHINLIKKVSSRNREINLHGFSETSNESTVNKEKKELERISGNKISGYRQHLLNYKFQLPESIIQLQKLSFSYDSSIGDNDRYGFVKGICHPYHPLIGKDKSNLIEISPSYEDWTSLSKKLTYKKQVLIINSLLETTRRLNGCIVFNIHNNYVNEIRYKELYEIFGYILDICEDDYWVTTLNGCGEWWRRRENAKIQILLDNDMISYSSDTELPIEITNEGKKTYKIMKNERFTI